MTATRAGSFLVESTGEHSRPRRRSGRRGTVSNGSARPAVPDPTDLLEPNTAATDGCRIGWAPGGLREYPDSRAAA